MDIPNIAYKVEQDSPAVTRFEINRFRPPRRGERMNFEVNVVAENLEGQVKRAHAKPNLPTWGAFVMHSDEGEALRGSDNAPCPLNYFTAGIAFCLLSHVQEYVESNSLSVDSAKLELRQFFYATETDVDVVAEHGLTGGSTGLELHLLIESNESQQSIEKLFHECVNSCLAIQSIVNPIPLNANLALNGDDVDRINVAQ
jgi:uncharacterized OsmC-like protein